MASEGLRYKFLYLVLFLETSKIVWYCIELLLLVIDLFQLVTILSSRRMAGEKEYFIDEFARNSVPQVDPISSVFGSSSCLV
jgi:hypothetical protein